MSGTGLLPRKMISDPRFAAWEIVGVLEDTFKQRWRGKTAFYSAIRRPSSADQ